jgi:hypothetical protein
MSTELLVDVFWSIHAAKPRPQGSTERRQRPQLRSTVSVWSLPRPASRRSGAGFAGLVRWFGSGVDLPLADAGLADTRASACWLRRLRLGKREPLSYLRFELRDESLPL